MSHRRHSGPFDVVVIVGSQGALPVARGLLSALPEGFPAAVVYVQHRVPSAGSILAGLVRRFAQLPVREAGNGDPVESGAIHVCRAGVQTTVDADRCFRVSEGSCLGDPLMASVAEEYGAASLGVVLSGRQRDGAAGLSTIKRAGGRGLIQSPESAEADGMPLAAMATGGYDFVLPPKGLQSALLALVTVPGAADLLTVRAHPIAAEAAL